MSWLNFLWEKLGVPPPTKKAADGELSTYERWSVPRVVTNLRACKFMNPNQMERLQSQIKKLMENHEEPWIRKAFRSLVEEFAPRLILRTSPEEVRQIAVVTCCERR